MTKEEAQRRIQSHLDEIGFLVEEYPDLLWLVDAFADEAEEANRAQEAQ